MGEPRCTRCPSLATWSIANVTDIGPITAWFACGRHLNAILTAEQWETDVVEIRDLLAPDPAS